MSKTTLWISATKYVSSMNTYERKPTFPWLICDWRITMTWEQEATMFCRPWPQEENMGHLFDPWRSLWCHTLTMMLGGWGPLRSITCTRPRTFWTTWWTNWGCTPIWPLSGLRQCFWTSGGMSWKMTWKFRWTVHCIIFKTLLHYILHAIHF